MNTGDEFTVERIFVISNFEEQIKSMLVMFLNERHANLLAGKIISELMQTGMVDECYLADYELWKGKVNE